MAYTGGAQRRTHSPPGHRTTVPHDGRALTFTQNAQLFAQGSTARRVLKITKGRVRLIRETGVKRLVVDEVGEGTLLGYNEALLGQRHWTAAVAIEATVVEIIEAEVIARQVSALPSSVQSHIQDQAKRELKLLEVAQAPAVEQSFLGICRGLELLIPAGSRPQPESQLVRRLRELFGLPTPVLKQVVRVLADLNLLIREQQGPMEATLRIEDPRVMERATGLVDRWLPSLPSILTKDGPREPYYLEELAEELDVQPQDIMRRMMGSDFPAGILRFDADGVAGVRAIHGDAFFKKRVTSKDVVAGAQSLAELTALDASVLREFVPHMEFTKLCQLLTRTTPDVQAHILGALTPRMRRVAKAEISQLPPVSDNVFADLESEMMDLAQQSVGGRV